MSREDYSGVLSTPRYELYDLLGKGSWGTVYAAKDKVLGGNVAIKVLTPSDEAKEKLRRREITPFEAVAREGGLVPAAHIVPRSFEIDENGAPFIVMPVYREFFNQRIGDSGRRYSVKDGSLDSKAVNSYLMDIARGVSEMHSTRRRAHADIKPDNIAVGERGQLLLNDLGNATLTSLDWAEKVSPRDNMGAWYTRAPELFLDDSHPERASDVWSFGAIAYRLITGKYPLEEELANVRDPQAYIASLGSEGLDAILKRKVRSNIKDGRMRALIRKSLIADPNKRLHSGDLVKRVENATEGTVLGDFGRFMKRFSIAAGAVSALSAAGYFMATAEPRSVPVPPKVSGLLYLEDNEGKTFDIEEPFELPEAREGGFSDGTDRIAKRSTTLPSIAYLVSCKAKAMLDGGAWGAERITDNEMELFEKHALPEEKERLEKSKTSFYNTGTSEMYIIPAVALEATMNSIRDARGRVDLEDLLVFSRVSPTKRREIELVKGYSQSGDFKDYQKALSEEEREFIKKWLAYVHNGLARK